MSTKSLDHAKNEKASSLSPKRTGILQRRCSDCHKKRRLLQRQATSKARTDVVPPIVHEVLRSPGQPLDRKTREFMESRFSHDFSQVRTHAAPQSASLTIGQANDSYEQEAERMADSVMQSAPPQRASAKPQYDFSQVRVHNDTKAAESACAVNALAYTIGKNIVFGNGQYSPGTTAGHRLLSHELVHTIQQSEAKGAHDVRLQRTIGDGHDLTSPRFAGDLKLEACYDDEARLTKGNQGDSVVAVQQALIDLGYDLGPTGADGIYGDLTWNAVKQFKADQNLGWEHMGDVGPGTMGRLDELFPASDPATPVPPIESPPIGLPGKKTFSCPYYAGDSKLEACLNDQDRLRPGDTGPSVMKVQNGLMRDDISVGPKLDDGIFGEKTGQGVMEFKKKHDLGFEQYPDVGPGTMNKLDELCNSSPPNPNKLPPCQSDYYFENEIQRDPSVPAIPGVTCQNTTPPNKNYRQKIKNVDLVRESVPIDFVSFINVSSLGIYVDPQLMLNGKADVECGPNDCNKFIFGILQVCRPYTAFHYAYHSPTLMNDLDSDHTSGIRSEQPEIDAKNAGDTWSSNPRSPKYATGAKFKPIDVIYEDFPGVEFRLGQPPGYYLFYANWRHSFFTSFSVQYPDNTNEILKSFYWDINYCEEFEQPSPGDALGKSKKVIKNISIGNNIDGAPPGEPALCPNRKSTCNSIFNDQKHKNTSLGHFKINC